ncbi:hypothetical protein BOX15_Mlig010006g2, partial [Macrostomum lignano]
LRNQSQASASAAAAAAAAPHASRYVADPTGAAAAAASVLSLSSAGGSAAHRFEGDPADTVHYWSLVGSWEDFKRSKHTMVAHIEAGRYFLYAFGGDNGRATLNDVLRYDIEARTWTQVLPVNGTPPAPRYTHSAVVADDSMLIFGGYTGEENKNDLFEYRFGSRYWAEWKFDAKSAKPVPRTAHCAFVYNGRMWIYAGYDGNRRLNDLWNTPVPSSYGASPMAVHFWEEAQQMGAQPPPLCNFSLTVCRDTLFVFSGESGSKSSNKLYQYDFSSSHWSVINRDNVLGCVAPAPEKVFGHSMLSYGRHLFVFGGVTGSSVMNQLFSYDLDDKTWSTVEPAAGSRVPDGRLYHSAVLVDSSMYIFGGNVEKNLFSGDMYRIQLSSYPRCTLQDDFGRLLQSNMLCDVEFLVGPDKQSIMAHQCFLAARSCFLINRIREARQAAAQQAAGQQPQSGPLRVRLPETDPTAFRLILSFVYTDQLQPVENAEDMQNTATILLMMQVYQLALQFQMSRLQHVVTQYLESCINDRNVVVTYERASELGQVPVKEYCLNFMTKDSVYKSVIHSREFEELDKPLILEVVRRRERFAASPSGAVSAANSANRIIDAHKRDILEHTNSLKKDMAIFLSTVGPDYSDVTLLLGEHRISAHRAVLAARCGYFEALFRSFPPKDDVVEVSFGKFVPTKQAFSNLLRYIYCGDMSMPPADLMYIANACDYYNFANDRLQAYCKQNIEVNISPDNVLTILEAADVIKSQGVKSHALRIVAKNARRIVDGEQSATLLRLPPQLLVEILRAVVLEK